jgi:subtilisin family serine protease
MAMLIGGSKVMRQSNRAKAAFLFLALIGSSFGAPAPLRSAEDPIWKAKVAPWLQADITLQARLQGSGAASGVEATVLALVPAGEGGGLDIDAARLSALGCEVLRQTKDIVLAKVPLSVVPQVIEDPAVGFVRPPFRPTLFESTASQAIGAGLWQQASYKASGVKVGIVDLEFQDYRNVFSQIQLTKYHTWSAKGVTFGGGQGPHGTACTEVLHDIAPGAEFYLAQIGTDTFEADLPTAFDWLRGKGVSVVSMSIGATGYYYDDGSSPVCDSVNEARAAGAIVCIAAGNEGDGYYWTGDFVDADGDGFLEFAPGDPGDDIEVGLETTGTLTLTWAGGERTAEDFDLFVYSKKTGQQVASSTVRQDGTQPALEVIYFETDIQQPVPADIFLLDPGLYEVRVQNVHTTLQHDVRLFVDIQDGDGRFIPLTRIAPQYSSSARSLSTPADAQGALAVGAWHTSNDQVADYSSRGPTADGRIKPDVVAPSGLTTIAYAPDTFEGTSASTPVCAGAAALLLGASPKLGPDDLEIILEINAQDSGTPRPDNNAGWGALNLPPVPPLALFHRGDMDGNGKMEITDAIFLLSYLFTGGKAPPCLDAADADDNGELQITDPILVLGYLFLGSSEPAEPSTTCGNDATPDSLGCESSTCP